MKGVAPAHQISDPKQKSSSQRRIGMRTGSIGKNLELRAGRDTHPVTGPSAQGGARRSCNGLEGGIDIIVNNLGVRGVGIGQSGIPSVGERQAARRTAHVCVQAIPKGTGESCLGGVVNVHIEAARMSTRMDEESALCQGDGGATDHSDRDGHNLTSTHNDTAREEASSKARWGCKANAGG